MDVDHRNLISLTGSPGPLLSKSGLDDLEDIDDDDDDDVILLTGDQENSTNSKKRPAPAVSPDNSFSWGTGSSDVDLRQPNLNLIVPEHRPATTSSSNTSITTTTTTSSTSEPKDLDMRIQSMQKTLDSHFGGDGESTDGSKAGDDALQLLQTPTSLLEIDDFLVGLTCAF